jgi:hypothetical protein
VLSLGLYLAGGPLIHKGHQQGWTALLDLGLRLGVPLAGYGIGVSVRVTGVTYPDQALASFANGLIGAMIGCVSVMAVDATWLAWLPPPPAQAEHASFRLTPVVGASRGGAPIVGLGGTF